MSGGRGLDARLRRLMASGAGKPVTWIAHEEDGRLTVVRDGERVAVDPDDLPDGVRLFVISVEPIGAGAGPA